MVLLPKRPSCQSGFIDFVSVISIVVLLVGLVAGTYLVGQRQELRKLAALPEEEAPPPEEVVQPPPPPEQPPQQPPEQPPQQPPPAEQPPSEGRACTYSDVGCEAGFHADGTYPKCSCEPDATPYCIEGLCPYGCDPSPSGGTCKTAPPPPPPQPPAPLCGDGTCNTEVGESCSTCPADCGVCPAPQPAQTPTVPLPGDYQSWRCPGPNCDKCGFQGWWASGCDPFIAAHPGDAPYAGQRYSGGQLTACGSVSKQCSSVGETRCGADTGYKETSCGNDGCYHETGGACQPTQLAQPVQPPLLPPPQPLVTGPCNLDEIQISCPNGEKVCQNLITGSPQCAAAAPAPSTCANCLAVARDPYECASECNLAVVSKVGYDPTAITSLIDENQKLKDLSLIKETILPKDYKPYDPGDSELVKKYGNGSLEQTSCYVGGPGFGTTGGCEPEALYLRDKYGVEKANRIIITKEAYKKTADLGCGDVSNLWGEKCKDAFQAYTAAGLIGQETVNTNTIAGLGTAFVAGLMGGPGGLVLFGTSDFLFSKTRLDEQESSKALLEDRYGKGVIDVGSTSFLGSASTLAQRAGIDTSSLGSASRVDILYRAYNSLVTNPFIIKPVPAAFDPKDVTDPNEQVRIIQEINKILTPSGSARGRVLPGPAKEQVKNWGEVVALQNMRLGFLAYKDTALSSGYGQVYLQKNDEFKRELTTNLALDAATAGVGHVVGQAFKGAVKGAEGTAVKKVVDDLAEKRLLTATEGLASEAERLKVIKGLINDAEVNGGEVVFKNNERLAADDVLLQTKFEQGLLSSSDIKGVILSGDEAAASELVKGAKEAAGLSFYQFRSDALARRALEEVDTKTLLKGLEEAGPDVTHAVESSKLGLPAAAKIPPPEAATQLSPIEEKLKMALEREAKMTPTERLELQLKRMEEEAAANAGKLTPAQQETIKVLEAEIASRKSGTILGSGPAQLFEDFSNATIYRVLPEARTEGVIPAVINRIRGGPKPPGGAELPVVEPLIAGTKVQVPPTADTIRRTAYVVVPGSFLIGTTLGVVERQTGVFGDSARAAMDFLVQNGVQPEGNPVQRSLDFEKIQREIAMRQGTEKQKYINEVAWPWLKSNGAEVYAENFKNYKLAAALLRHFLYGKGEFDMTRLYKDSVIDYYRSSIKEKSKLSDDEIIYDFLSNSFNYGFSYNRVESTLKVTSSKDAFQQAMLTGKPYHIKLARQASSSDFILDPYPLAYSLNLYGMLLDGEVIKISTNKSDSNLIDLTFRNNAKFIVYDTYDWESSIHLSGPTLTLRRLIGTFLESYGYKTEKDFFLPSYGNSQDTLRVLDDTKVTLDDSEMRSLVNNQIGHEFNVRGGYVLPKQFTISVSKKLFEK